MSSNFLHLPKTPLSPYTHHHPIPPLPTPSRFPFSPIPISPKLIFTHTHNQIHPPQALNKDEYENQENQENEEREARGAVCEFLEKHGVSKEESLEISLKCPKYLEMLVDGVRELNELSLWDSWGSDGDGEGGGFKKKVYDMAEKKGDKGMLCFLESVGLSLTSSMHVGRYLSSHSLPSLIHKVKYMKEIFFSDSNGEAPLGKNARRMMMHLSIPIDEDLQQTLSFFEKIQARRGGLDLLGSGDVSFGYLIESFPRLLLLPVESHMKPRVKFLEDIGVPKECMRNILLLFPPTMFYNIEKDIKPRIQAFEKVNAVNKDVGKMLLKYPWILSTSIQENYEEMLIFFDMHRVPKASVDRAIKSWPHLLGCSTGKLKLMMQQFDELGVRHKKLGRVIAKSPQLLLKKPHEFLQVVSFLEDLGLDEETVSQILGRCPEIFATSIENVLKKKVEFLISIGVPRNHLPRVIAKYPELFVCDINKALLPRMKYLLKIGLSKKDVAFMVRRFSPLLGYSVDEVLRPKLEFLVKTMEKPLSEVVEYPRYFSYSLEKKIEPRHWVLKGRNVECSLKDMLGKNDEEFAADYVMGVGSMPGSPPLER